MGPLISSGALDRRTRAHADLDNYHALQAVQYESTAVTATVVQVVLMRLSTHSHGSSMPPRNFLKLKLKG